MIPTGSPNGNILCIYIIDIRSVVRVGTVAAIETMATILFVKLKSDKCILGEAL